MRRAKIVCTLGPATAAPERILELVQAGMDVARLNLSHGAHAEHEPGLYMFHAHQSEFTELGWMGMFDVVETLS